MPKKQFRGLSLFLLGILLILISLSPAQMYADLSESERTTLPNAEGVVTKPTVVEENVPGTADTEIGQTGSVDIEEEYPSSLDEELPSELINEGDYISTEAVNKEMEPPIVDDEVETEDKAKLVQIENFLNKNRIVMNSSNKSAKVPLK